MISYGRKEVASAIYSVAADPSGGAIGTIKLGVNFPGTITPGSFVTITAVSIVGIATLTSAGAATLSFGLQANVNGTLTPEPTILAPVTTIAAINASVDAQNNFQPLQGSVSPANPLKIYPTLPAAGGAISGWDLIMAIGTAALTAGSVQIQVELNVTPQ